MNKNNYYLKRYQNHNKLLSEILFLFVNNKSLKHKSVYAFISSCIKNEFEKETSKTLMDDIYKNFEDYLILIFVDFSFFVDMIITNNFILS